MKKYITIILSLFPGLLYAQYEKTKTYNSISISFSPDLNLYTYSQTHNLNYTGIPSFAYRFKIDMRRPFSERFEFKLGVSYGLIKSNLTEHVVTTVPIIISHRYKFGIFSTGIQYFLKRQVYANFDIGLMVLNQYGQPLKDLSVAPFVGCGVGWQQPIKNISLFIQPSFRYMFHEYGLNDLESAKLLPSISIGLEIGVRSYIYRLKAFTFKGR